MDEASEVIFTLDENGILTYCNPSFERFAVQNGAPELTAARVVGTCFQANLPRVLQGFFRESLERARTTLELWRFEYDCSSADIYRKFQLTLFPQPNRKEFVFVHSRLIERPHTWPAVDGIESAYRCRDGLIHMCCNCRRARCQESARWDWVPDFVRKRPLDVSHGICSFCRDWLYGAQYAVGGSGVADSPGNN